MPPLVYRGAKEICNVVGIPWKDIGHFIQHEGLPAWKINGRGTWLALHDDLAEWLRTQRDRAVERSMR